MVLEFVALDQFWNSEKNSITYIEEEKLGFKNIYSHGKHFLTHMETPNCLEIILGPTPPRKIVTFSGGFYVDIDEPG
jgi:hypothetical protein